jgi:hypothetical protein
MLDCSLSNRYTLLNVIHEALAELWRLGCIVQ